MADKKSFEEQMQELEGIVSQMEQGELPLEDAMKLYENGVKLTTSLNHSLRDARLKIEELKGSNDDANI